MPWNFTSWSYFFELDRLILSSQDRRQTIDQNLRKRIKNIFYRGLIQNFRTRIEKQEHCLAFCKSCEQRPLDRSDQPRPYRASDNIAAVDILWRRAVWYIIYNIRLLHLQSNVQVHTINRTNSKLPRWIAPVQQYAKQVVLHSEP